MLAFGLGTLPSMLGMSLAAPALAALLSDQWTRKLMGTAMILLAVLSVSLMAVHSQSRHEQHGQIETATEVGMQQDHSQNQ